MAADLYTLMLIADQKRYVREDVAFKDESEKPIFAKMLAEDGVRMGLNLDQVGEIIAEMTEMGSDLWNKATGWAKAELALLDELAKEREREASTPRSENGVDPAKARAEFAKRLVPFALTAKSEEDFTVRPVIAARRLQRQIVTGLIAPGGVGKSLLGLQWAIAIATGNGAFCGLDVIERTNVLVINNEDTQDELDRRSLAVFKHFAIPHEEAHGRLFTWSGYGATFRMAVRNDRGPAQPGPLVEAMVETIRKNNIGVVIIDPLISTSAGLDENSNPDMEALMDVYRSVCAATHVALLTPHHSRKMNKASSEGHSGEIDSARGASAIPNAWRIGLTLYNVSEDDAEEFHIPVEIRHRYVRLDETEKFNQGVRNPRPELFKRESVLLMNAKGQKEWVGVLVPAFRDAGNVGEVLMLMKKAIAAGKALSPNLQSPTSAAAWIVSEQQPELYDTDPETFKAEKAKAASAIGVLVSRGVLSVIRYDNKTKEGGEKYALSEDSAWPEVPKAS